MVADGDEPGAGEVVFDQSHNPVAGALVVDSGVVFAVAAHPFGFETENVFAVDFPGEVGDEDVVVVDVAFVSFDDGIEEHISVGSCQFDFAAEFLGHFEAEVAIVGVAGAEEGGGVSVGAFSADECGVKAGDERCVEVDVGAVFAAEQGFFLELVHKVGLESHFACALSSVGVHREEGVGVLLGDGRRVVDVEHFAADGADGLEAHIVDAFGLDVGAESFLGVACAEPESFAVLVDIVVHNAGVLSFACIFGLESEAAVSQVHTQGTCSDIVRQVELVAGDVGGDCFVAFVLADEGSAEGEACFGFVPAFDDVVERYFGIETADESTRFPIVSLLSNEAFESYAVPGAVDDVEAPDCVVEAEVAVFVGAESHTVAELFVEMASCDGEGLGLVADEIVGDALSCVLAVEAEHWVEVGFVAQSGAEVAVGVENVGTCVAEQFFWHVA